MSHDKNWYTQSHFYICEWEILIYALETIKFVKYNVDIMDYYIWVMITKSLCCVQEI